MCLLLQVFTSILSHLSCVSWMGYPFAHQPLVVQVRMHVEIRDVMQAMLLVSVVLPPLCGWGTEELYRALQ